MKRKLLFLLLIVFFTSLLSSPLFPVELKKSGNSSDTYSGDISLSVRLVGGKGAVFKSGRDVNLTFQTSRDAYVIIYNVDSEGFVNLLFPADGRLRKVRGREVHFLPEKNSGLRWRVGGKTGIEYIQALAVTDRDDIREDELYFLAHNREDERFRIDMDPFLAFNMINEEILVDTDRNQTASDYTYFYINRKVDYPRFLCASCHGHDEFANPYAEDCKEIVIDRVAYEEDLYYPYPALYEISHMDDDDDDYYYSSNLYGTREYEDLYDYDDDVDIHISLGYTNWAYPHYFYGPYVGSYGIYFGDPFWWGLGFSWHWADYYWWRYPYYHNHWAYYNCCHSNYCYWNCHHDRFYHHNRYRPIYASRNIAKRRLDHITDRYESRKNRTLVSTRLATSRAYKSVSASRLSKMSKSGSLSKFRDRYSPARAKDVTRKQVYGAKRSRSYEESRNAAKARSAKSARSQTLRKNSGDRKMLKSQDRQTTGKKSSQSRQKAINRSSKSSSRNSSSRKSTSSKQIRKSSGSTSKSTGSSSSSRSKKSGSKPSRSSSSSRKSVSRKSAPARTPSKPASTGSGGSSSRGSSSGRSGKSGSSKSRK